jgi:undecaprenyl diphosphate synthase
MDGNGRWARRRGLPRNAGHQAGLKTLRRILRVAHDQGIGCVTVFAFSSENWCRPQHEVRLLMDLLVRGLRKHVSELHARNVRVRFIGNRGRLPAELCAQLSHSEELTASNSGSVLNVAIDYGGQWDLAQAATAAAREHPHGVVDEHSLKRHLCLSDCPDPDLLIRTGGEQRLSNFLLWQLAYTELYFTDVYWPDFSQQDFIAALESYHQRDRRFGKVEEIASDNDESQGASSAYSALTSSA